MRSFGSTTSQVCVLENALTTVIVAAKAGELDAAMAAAVAAGKRNGVRR